jgi:hypothetical protein
MNDSINLDLRIGALGDSVLFPEFNPGQRAEVAGVGILEKGTASGDVSVGILVRFEHHNLVVEMSGAMLLAIASAVKGARERFGVE